MGERDDDPRAWARNQLQRWQPLAGELASEILKAGFSEVGLKGAALESAVRRTWTWDPPRLQGLLADLSLALVHLDARGFLSEDISSSSKKKPKPTQPNPF